MSMFVVIWYFFVVCHFGTCNLKVHSQHWRSTNELPHLKVQFPLSGRCFCGKFCKRVGKHAGGSRGKWQKHPNKHIQKSPIFEKSPFLGRTFASFFGGVPTSWIVSVLGEVKILLRGKTCYLCDSLVIQHGLTVEVLQSDVTRSSSLSACPQAQKSPEINHFQKIF